MLYAGTQRTKKAKRFRKYLALIGRRESISITTLAQAMPISVHKACDDLQEMLDTGILSTGYLDMSSGRLILNDEGLREEEPAPQPEEAAEEKDTLDINDDDAVLGEIRRVNDAIADEEMSRKIDPHRRDHRKNIRLPEAEPGQGGAASELFGVLPAHHAEDPQRLCADGGPGD